MELLARLKGTESRICGSSISRTASKKDASASSPHCKSTRRSDKVAEAACFTDQY